MHLNRRTFATGIASTAGLRAAPGAWAQSTPNAIPDATPVSDDLETQLMAVLEERGVPGAVVAMQTAETSEPTIYELGSANAETNEPVSADMHFRIGSVTKPFVATVVLQLVDEEHLSLDDTIADVYPNLNVANTDIITIRHLLTMRSGLPQVTDSPEEIVGILREPTTEVTFDDIVDIVTSMPARFKPDEKWEYNNLNFQILGEIINLVTGETWDANVDTRILQPLGLTNTLMTDVPEMPTPFAHGYGYDGESPMVFPDTTTATEVTASGDASPVAKPELVDVTLFNPTIAGAAGGMISTVTDQLIWAQNLAVGALLSPEMHAAQIDGRSIGNDNPMEYGLGVMGHDGMIGHYGDVNGYQAGVMAAPDGSLSIAIASNAMPALGDAKTTMELMAAILDQ